MIAAPFLYLQPAWMHLSCLGLVGLAAARWLSPIIPTYRSGMNVGWALCLAYIALFQVNMILALGHHPQSWVLELLHDLLALALYAAISGAVASVVTARAEMSEGWRRAAVITSSMFAPILLFLLPKSPEERGNRPTWRRKLYGNILVGYGCILIVASISLASATYARKLTIDTEFRDRVFAQAEAYGRHDLIQEYVKIIIGSEVFIK